MTYRLVQDQAAGRSVVWPVGRLECLLPPSGWLLFSLSLEQLPSSLKASIELVRWLATGQEESLLA